MSDLKAEAKIILSGKEEQRKMCYFLVDLFTLASSIIQSFRECPHNVLLQNLYEIITFNLMFLNLHHLLYRLSRFTLN